jgi:phosphate transport system substrate-binding protein
VSLLKSKKIWFVVGLTMVLVLLSTIGMLGCNSQTSTPEAAETTKAAEAVETPASQGDSEEQMTFETTNVSIVGSDTSLEVSQALVEAFLALYPNQNLNLPITGGGSGTGIAGLIDGTADLANSSRPIKAEEIEIGKANGLDITEVTIAFDGISVVINKDNPVDELTVAQISKIFTGEIKNWSEVGGPDAQIVITSRDSSSGTHVFFKEEVVQLGGSAKENDYSELALFLASTSAIREEVSTNMNAIGYIGLGYLDDTVKAVAVKVDEGSAAVLPSVENVMNGSYAVARGLFVYTPQPVNQLSDLAQAYLEFVLSDAGQAIVAEIGFVPVQ